MCDVYAHIDVRNTQSVRELLMTLSLYDVTLQLRHFFIKRGSSSWESKNKSCLSTWFCSSRKQA
jgi:hypothetical protein